MDYALLVAMLALIAVVTVVKVAWVLLWMEDGAVDNYDETTEELYAMSEAERESEERTYKYM